nr:HAMP domain-containing histidine kinase [Treponema sp.]
IYDADSHETFFVKNDKIPELPLTNGRSRRIYKKKFFDDSDLNIVYVAEKITLSTGQSYVVQIVQNTENDAGRRIFKGLPLSIMLAAIPILLISLLLSLYITRKTIKPVVQITNAVNSITSNNLETLLPETFSGDEIDILAHTFNQLLKRLKSDFDRERSFTSNVSHELKTPVAVILGQANLIRRWGKDEPEQLEKSIATILREGKSMQSVITNLLELTHLDLNSASIQKEEFELNELLHNLSEEVNSIAPDCKIKLNTAEKTLVNTDRELLHQLLTIVLSNSVKFAGPECEVTINSTIKDKNNFTLQITDNGPGFEKEILPYVFDRFFKGDKAHNRTQGGSGLGLSIAKSIVKTLGGTISAENAHEGGALIRICLGC